MTGKNNFPDVDVQHQAEAAHRDCAGMCDWLMAHRDDQVSPLSTALQTGNRGLNLIQLAIWEADGKKKQPSGEKNPHRG